MKIYSYAFKSASGDYHHIMTLNDYDDVYMFMKNELPWEYDAFKDEWDEEWGEWDETTIDYEYYDKQVFELPVA